MKKSKPSKVRKMFLTVFFIVSLLAIAVGSYINSRKLDVGSPYAKMVDEAAKVSTADNKVVSAKKKADDADKAEKKAAAEAKAAQLKALDLANKANIAAAAKAEAVAAAAKAAADKAAADLAAANKLAAINKADKAAADLAARNAANGKAVGAPLPQNPAADKNCQASQGDYSYCYCEPNDCSGKRYSPKGWNLFRWINVSKGNQCGTWTIDGNRYNNGMIWNPATETFDIPARADAKVITRYYCYGN